jgi:hypothetical protein
VPPKWDGLAGRRAAEAIEAAVLDGGAARAAAAYR